MNFRKKNAVYLLFISVCLAFVPVIGYAKEGKETADKTPVSETSVMEVSDFAEFQEAVAEVTQEEGIGRSLPNVWQNHRLLV